jgi:hypothetical protein
VSESSHSYNNMRGTNIDTTTKLDDDGVSLSFRRQPKVETNQSPAIIYSRYNTVINSIGLSSYRFSCCSVKHHKSQKALVASGIDDAGGLLR